MAEYTNDELEAARRKVMCMALPTLGLLALEHWGLEDEKNGLLVGPTHDIVQAELARRQRDGYWIDTDFLHRNGQHPYTPLQVAQKYQEIRANESH